MGFFVPLLKYFITALLTTTALAPPRNQPFRRCALPRGTLTIRECRSCHFRGGNVCGEVNLPARRSHGKDLLEDRLTHCGHSLDAVFPLPAERSNFTLAQKRSDQFATARL